MATCLNDRADTKGLIGVSKYPADTEVPWFRSRVVCAKCGGLRQQDRRAGRMERAATQREPDKGESSGGERSHRTGRLSNGKHVL